MKIAVTGAAGYLGKILIRLLEANSAVESIVAIDVAPVPASNQLKYVRRDVRDPAILHDLKGCDALAHMAFIVMPIHSEEETDSINIDGSKNVFTRAAEAGIRKIVHLSSVAAYGAWPDNPDPLYENSPLRPMPQFYYSRTKAAVERWLDDFEREHAEISIVRLRPCIFLGPDINNLMVEIMARKKIPLFSGHSSRVQFVWDEDVADAIMLALFKEVRGAFNIAGDNPITLQQWADIIGAKTFTLPYPLAYWSSKLIWALRLSRYLHSGWAEVLRFSINVNCDKAKKELGWTPRLDSAGALKRFAKEFAG